MKKMKKLLALVLTCIMLTSVLAGCGGSSSGGSSSGGNPSGGSTSDSKGGSGSEEKSVTLRINNDYAENSPSGKLLAEFCQRVSDATDGTVTIKPYYSGALGDYVTVFEEVSKGSIDMTFNSIPVTFGEVFGITGLPYLASTWDEAAKVYASGGYLDTTMKELCGGVGVELLSLYMVGAGGLAASKMPSNWETWGAEHDILIRVPNADLHRIPMEAMGYRTQGVNWAELFTAVQTGVVDGFVGGHPAACYEQFRDVIKYYSQINNFFESAAIGINKDLFDSLSERQQKALQDAALWVFNESISRGEAEEDEYMQMMSDYGIEVIKPDPEILESWAKSCREEVWPQLKESIQNDEIFDALVASLSE